MNFKTKFASTVLLSGALLCTKGVSAQERIYTPNLDTVSEKITSYKPGYSHFMVVGLFTMGYVNESTDNTPIGGVKTTTKNSSIGDADRFEFSPMLLWRQSNRVLLEFEPSFAYDGTSAMAMGVNWADVSYFVAPGLIVRGGYLVMPFGIYSKRLAAGWINKLASDPIGMDMPGSDFGVELEGGFPLGNMKWSYDVAIANGFQIDGNGQVSNVGIVSPNQNKTISGRIGLLPLSNSSLEIGFSALGGGLYTQQGLSYNNPSLSMYAIDLSYYKKLGGVTVTLKGQYNIQSINKQSFLNPADTTHTLTYSFDNNITNGFGQFSIRPTGLESKLRNLELGYRYVMYKTPDASLWGQSYTENDVALSYWLTWRQVIKVAYENIQSTTAANSIGVTGGTSNTSRFVIQFSTEF